MAYHLLDRLAKTASKVFFGVQDGSLPQRTQQAASSLKDEVEKVMMKGAAIDAFSAIDTDTNVISRIFDGDQKKAKAFLERIRAFEQGTSMQALHDKLSSRVSTIEKELNALNTKVAGIDDRLAAVEKVVFKKATCASSSRQKEVVSDPPSSQECKSAPPQ